MNTRSVLFFLALWPFFLVSCDRGAYVFLRSDHYSFSDFIPKVELSGSVIEGDLYSEKCLEDGFCVTFDVDLAPDFCDSEILCIDNVLSVGMSWYKPVKKDVQNYIAFPLADGTIPVLEARLYLQNVGKVGPEGTIRVGVPLGMLENPWGKHCVVLNYTGVQFTIYVDGKLCDNDFVLGYPSAENFTRWHRDVNMVSYAGLSYESVSPIRTGKVPTEPKVELQYFIPSGHNAWLGDVATCWYNGRYHVFYLYDRRGHKGKLGVGGHYFEHISTADFKVWTEHEPACPIEEQWHTLGTGTPFVYRDSLYLSYGFHTTRISDDAQEVIAYQWRQIKDHGYTLPIDMDTLQLLPAGSTYAVCVDGVSEFRNSGMLIHPCENPSISAMPDGTLMMFANYRSKGTWVADHPNGPWRCVDEEFPLGGDCTFPFVWGDYEYIIGGFTQMWRKSDAGIEDLVAMGKDFYDGVSVPCVTEVENGRRMLAGWVKVDGHWGGALVIRELLQCPDGTLETSWVPELMPLMQRSKRLARKVDSETVFNTGQSSYMLTFDIVEAESDAQVALQFQSPESGAATLWWKIDNEVARAQFSDNQGDIQKTVREGAKPHKAHNYAIENLPNMEKRYPVRIIVKNSNKLGGSLVDGEICGRRTMITYRRGLDAEIIRLIPNNAVVENICIYQP